jgi:DNA invertase Pin-like site-specific DNA recombinase
MGRKTKCTDEIIQAIAQRIRDGMYPRLACAAEGMHRATYYRWIERGEVEEEGLFREFRNTIKKAEALAEADVIACIR